MMRRDDYIKGFIQYNIETNDYYEDIKDMYDKVEDKNYFVKRILKCFDRFNSYYSIYVILDSIVAFMNEHEDIRDIDDIIDHEDFDLVEY